jgi:signal recognition particle receptor subunit beta
MKPYNIIFTGPTNSGKTTAIETISDTPPYNPANLSNTADHDKGASTKKIQQYGILKLKGGEKVHLHEAKSEAQDNPDWDKIISNGLGLILLLDNTRADPFKDMWLYLDTFKEFITETHVAIGITKMDRSNKPSVPDYHSQLQTSALKPPVFTTDVRVKNDVSLLVESLLYSLNPGLSE